MAGHDPAPAQDDGALEHVRGNPRPERAALSAGGASAPGEASWRRAKTRHWSLPPVRPTLGDETECAAAFRWGRATPVARLPLPLHMTRHWSDAPPAGALFLTSDAPPAITCSTGRRCAEVRRSRSGRRSRGTDARRTGPARRPSARTDGRHFPR